MQIKLVELCKDYHGESTGTNEFIYLHVDDTAIAESRDDQASFDKELI